MIKVTHKKAEVATITRQNSTAEGYTPQEPWVLQYAGGRVERYPKLNTAKYEANKTWPGCKFIN